MTLDTLTLAAEGGNVFAGTIYQAVAAAIVFLTLLFILKTKAWGPILKGLQDRENKIKSDLEAAERANADAHANLKAYQEQLTHAQAEAKRIIDQGRMDMAKINAQLKEQTQAEITSMRQQVQRDIQNAKDQAVKQLVEEVGLLSTQIAGQILKRELNANDQAELVRDSIAKYGSKN
jgi:F-type H+-transporting ATPase subunit b